MAITNTTATRNTVCDAQVDLCDVGTTDAAGELRIQTSGDVDLVTFDLNNPAFGAAASGVATANGLPLSNTAVATGTADRYRVYNRDNTEQWRGQVSTNATATKAIVTGTGATYASVTNGDVLHVQVTDSAGVNTYITTFDGTENTQALFHDVINKALERSLIGDASGQSELRSDEEGLHINVEVLAASTAAVLTSLGFTSGQNASGVGGGDIQLDSISITSGQTVNITAWTFTAP